MASVTVNLTGYDGAGTFNISWDDHASLGSTFDDGGAVQTLTSVRLRDAGGSAGRVDLILLGANMRFTPAFESTGRIIFTASDGETLEVMIANADMTEPYEWTPNNAAEVIAFATHVRGLTDHDATLTLTDEDAPDPPSNQLATPVPRELPVSDTDTQFAWFWDNIDNAESYRYVLTNDGDDETISGTVFSGAGGNPGDTAVSFASADPGTTYTITVYAVPASGSTYTESEGGVASQTTTVDSLGVSVTLGGYEITSSYVGWVPAVQMPGSIFASGDPETISSVQLYLTQSATPDRVVVHILGANNRFTPDIENNGYLTFTHGNQALSIQIEGADTDEPYDWIPSNRQEIRDFTNYIRNQAGNKDVTFTVSGTVPLDQPATQLATPIPMELPQSGDTAFAWFWANIDNAESYRYVLTEEGSADELRGTVPSGAGGNPGDTAVAFANETLNTTYTITVYAVPASGSTLYLESEGGTASHTTGSGNVAPDANAGPDQNVAAGAEVTLDGSGSSDSDGNIAAYSWFQTAGNAVVLSDATIAGPTFNAPSTALAQTLTFRLTVTDDDGATDFHTVDIHVAAMAGSVLRPTVPVTPGIYKIIPPVVAGDEWTREDFNCFIVNNLNALYALLTGAAPSNTFSTHEVLIGLTGGAIGGLDVGDGEMVRGTVGAPESFGPPAANDVLQGIGGVPTWAAPGVFISLADILLYT